MGLKFAPPGNTARFALSIGNFFRTYETVGIAKMALHSHRWTNETAFILELVEGQWFVLYTVGNPRVAVAENNLPWYKEVRGYSSWGGWQDRKKAVPMPAAEYAAWRVQVDHELIAEKPLDQIVALFDTFASV